MPDYVHPTTLEAYRSVWPQPAGTVEVTREQLTAVQAIPHKYRKWNGSAIVEMTQAEKDTVDAAEAAARTQALRTEAQQALGQTRDDRSLIIRALGLVVLDEVNAIRAHVGMPAQTFDAVANALAQKIAAGEGEA